MTPHEIDQQNILNALRDDPQIKLCRDCKHFSGGQHCLRDRKIGMNHINGKVTTIGETHNCTIERELINEYDSLVANGSLCGAIGQHWEKKDPTIGWFKRWSLRRLLK